MSAVGPGVVPSGDGPGRTLADLIDERQDRTVSATADTLPALRTFNVIAKFTDSAEARQAIVSLERSGVDGGRVSSVSAARGDSAQDAVPEKEGYGKTDPEGVSGVAARRALTGGLIGGLIAAVLFTIGARVIGGSEIDAGGYVAAAIGGLGLGGAIGAILGAFSGFGTSDAYKASFEAVPGGITYVGVHTDDPEEAGSALSHLRSSASDVRVLDHDGQPVSLGR